MRYHRSEPKSLSPAADAAAGTTSYGYNGVGSLQTVRYPNNVTNTYTYDGLNRLTNLVARNSGGTIASFAYRLAAAGNRTNLIENVGGSLRTNIWQYDPLYRLTNEVITGASPTGTISYRYDAVGNRTNRASSVTGLTNQAFTLNTNDWLTTDVYDSNGSTRTNGANVFFYDVENRLTNATVGGITVSYTYNADGIRVSKTTGGTTTLYLVDDRNPTGYAQVLEEVTVSGGTTNLAKVFTYGHDLIAQRIVSSGQRSFYGYDGNGNTRYLTGTNAAISDTYVYDAYGTLLASTGSTANDYLYTGEQRDPNLGFYYLRARYLNAGTGRFWTRDTHPGNNQDPLSLHKYLYAHADPVNRIDPSGHISYGELGTVMAQLSYLGSRTYSAINIVRARAYVNLAKVVLNQDKIFLYLEATGAGLVAAGLVGGVMDDMAARLLRNTESMSDDHFTRGRQIERIAGANLGGNVEAIDDLRPGGVATQGKSIGLESGMDLDRRILDRVRDTARELGNVDRDLEGTTHDGRRIQITRDQIQHKVLTVAIPENHAPVVQSRYVRQALQNYRAAYGVYIQIVPVKGWRR